MKMVQNTLLKILMTGMLLGLAACGGGESDQGNLKYQAVASLSLVSSSTDPVGAILFDLKNSNKKLITTLHLRFLDFIENKGIRYKFLL